ncbi:hypothetical protein OZX68_06700 [Streptococcaceae bacterium ESL0729]|nr:hypothetical protein OZX68_06700 [Streptococcaceae bacterium ESL0729]
MNSFKKLLALATVFLATVALGGTNLVHADGTNPPTNPPAEPTITDTKDQNIKASFVEGGDTVKLKSISTDNTASTIVLTDTNFTIEYKDIANDKIEVFSSNSKTKWAVSATLANDIIQTDRGGKELARIPAKLATIVFKSSSNPTVKLSPGVSTKVFAYDELGPKAGYSTKELKSISVESNLVGKDLRVSPGDMVVATIKYTAELTSTF